MSAFTAVPTINEKVIAKSLEGFDVKILSDLLSELGRIWGEAAEVPTVSVELAAILRSQDIPVSSLKDKKVYKALTRIILSTYLSKWEEDDSEEQELCDQIGSSTISTSEQHTLPLPVTNNKCNIFPVHISS